MVLAAGLGKRMLPITKKLPKPLVRIGGMPLLDWCLNALAAAGVSNAVVNVHYLPEQIIDHVATRSKPQITISDERERLLDSGGGIVQALSLLGSQPFYVVNADTFWIDADMPNLDRLALAWDSASMDILLMLADPQSATGHSGGGDFHLAADGTLSRARGAPDGMIYAGAAIMKPALFAGSPIEPHSLNQYFDAAIATGRLHGIVMRGSWVTVGTPDAIPLAEAVTEASPANG
ncbi:NTP transferase domain-containing protein [Mesorhizobium sp. NBSH29]|uniref:nucleotidyltransferase family protein n=1 Tax=Mesorhizobium sp. NBSH29 TaxID=2654249 RepID=UPI001896587A|nr:nucleotidyltransferase family protein [Mesorhizobium sp. NBSH29]QPC88530.1 NTP transferase domain-containing protein [Mesorhizobium sp. NBSH29]